MHTLAVTLVLSLSAQTPDAPANAAGPAATPIEQPGEEPAQRSAEKPVEAPIDADAEQRALDQLRNIEARLSTGAALTDAERATPARALASDPSPRVRALAAAVLAWIDASAAGPPLVGALKDSDVRVRTTAAQSLLSLSRRIDDDARKDTLVAALGAMDDPADEVACAAAELVQALAPSAAADAVRARADTVRDVRYACFSRLAGLPPRAVEVPPLPPDPRERAPDGSPNGSPDGSPDGSPSTDTPPLTPPVVRAAGSDGTWLLVAAMASSGALAAGVLPGAFFPSRDVLTYTPTRTRLAHEEVSFFAQAGAAIAGAGAFGGGAYGITRAFPVTVDQALTATLVAGTGMLAGSSLQLALGLDDWAANATIAGATAAGAVAGTALALFSTPTIEDHALALGLAAGGVFLGALAVFTITPVGYDQIGDAFRTDFGFGIAGLSTAALTTGGLVAGMFLDVPVARTAGAVGGGLLAGSLLAGASFLVIPNSIGTKSRIACGIGLGGAVAGALAGAIFVPSEWFEDPATPNTVAPAAVALDLTGDAQRTVSLGIPTLAPIEGRAGDLGLTGSLVTARF